MNDYADKRKELELLRSSLSLEYAQFRNHHRELGDFWRPSRPRFFVSNSNRGSRKNGNIIINVGTLAIDTLASAMMSSLTSPTVPWLKLSLADQVREEDYAAQEWLDDFSDQILTIYSKSNLYDSLRELYADAATFGTSVMLIEEDFERVLHTTILPIGSYYLGLGKQNRVEVIFREFQQTVRQLIRTYGDPMGTGEIGWSHFSERVKAHWDAGEKDVWIDVCHVIKPNDNYGKKSSHPENRGKKFESCYYERGFANGQGYEANKDRYLRESGYERFPAIVFRWATSGEDVWGTDCPGMTALGDVKAIQHLAKMHARAVDKSVDPPLRGPASLRDERVSSLPNDINYVDMATGNPATLEPVYITKPDTRDLMVMFEMYTRQIQSACYNDVILTVTNPLVRETEKTAREVDEIHDEKYMRYGSVLVKLNSDVLSPLAATTLEFMRGQGYFEFSPPPESVAGSELRVEFISAMAQSQKLVSLGSIDRVANFAITMAGALGDNASMAFRKLKIDEMMDEYVKRSGAPASIIKTDDEVAEEEKARAELQAKQAMVEAAPQLAGAAKDLSEADPTKPSVLKNIGEAMQR